MGALTQNRHSTLLRGALAMSNTPDIEQPLGT